MNAVWNKILEIAYERLNEPTRHGSQSGRCSLQDVTIGDRSANSYFSEFQKWPSVQSARMPFAFYAAFMLDAGIRHPMHEEDILDMTGIRKPFVEIPEFFYDFFSDRFAVPKERFGLSYEMSDSTLFYGLRNNMA